MVGEKSESELVGDHGKKGMLKCDEGGTVTSAGAFPSWETRAVIITQDRG